MNLSREDFRLWLVAKEPDEVVGITNQVSDCPGAEWLKAQGHRYFCVDYNEDEDDGELRAEALSDDSVPCPSWLTQFAVGVDTRVNGRIENVTAKQAIEVLDSLE